MKTSGTRWTTFRLTPALYEAGGQLGGPCLCNLQARSLGGPRPAGRPLDTAGDMASRPSNQSFQLSMEESSAYAAATWVYETQWQAASCHVQVGAVSTMRPWGCIKPAVRPWTISSGNVSTPLRADSSSIWAAASDSSADAVAAVAQLVKMLQQMQQGQMSGLRHVTISTVAATAAALCHPVGGGRAATRTGGVAGAALWGALRTAALEDAALQATAHDAAVECTSLTDGGSCSGHRNSSCCASAMYLPR